LPANGRRQLVVTGLRGHIKRARGEVKRAHRVAAPRARRPDRDVVLKVLLTEGMTAQGASPAALDEEAGEF
jgi:hypothetical protein